MWSNEAQVLQYQVLESARKYYGLNHPSTLHVMDVLGAPCLMCSRLAEANPSHEQVIAKSSNSEGFGLNTRMRGELWITFPRLSFAILTMKRRSSCNCKLMRGWRGSWVRRLKKLWKSKIILREFTASLTRSIYHVPIRKVTRLCKFASENLDLNTRLLTTPS